MGKRELVIIGAGPAGLTAAIYGKRSGLDVLVLEKGIPGGQINSTGEIENWTGVLHASGAELAGQLQGARRTLQGRVPGNGGQQDNRRRREKGHPYR